MLLITQTTLNGCINLQKLDL